MTISCIYFKIFLNRNPEYNMYCVLFTLISVCYICSRVAVCVSEASRSVSTSSSFSQPNAASSSSSDQEPSSPRSPSHFWWLSLLPRCLCLPPSPTLPLPLAGCWHFPSNGGEITVVLYKMCLSWRKQHDTSATKHHTTSTGSLAALQRQLGQHVDFHGCLFSCRMSGHSSTTHPRLWLVSRPMKYL